MFYVQVNTFVGQRLLERTMGMNDRDEIWLWSNMYTKSKAKWLWKAASFCLIPMHPPCPAPSLCCIKTVQISQRWTFVLNHSNLWLRVCLNIFKSTSRIPRKFCVDLHVFPKRKWIPKFKNICSLAYLINFLTSLWLVKIWLSQFLVFPG